MMTKVCNLQEIVSVIPPSEEHPRQFTIVPNYPLWVDLSKAVVARTFNGQLLLQDEKDRTLYKPEMFVEIFWDGTLCVTTMLTPEVRKGLVGFLTDDETPSKNPFWKNQKMVDDGRELPYNERKSLDFGSAEEDKGDEDTWN